MTPDPTANQPLPQHIQDTLDTAEQHVSTGENHLVDALVNVHDTAHKILDQSSQALMPTLDEVIGQTDNKIGTGEDIVRKAANSVLRTAHDTLSNGYGQLASNGWRFPNQASEQNVVLNTGVAQYLPAMVPEFNQLASSGTLDTTGMVSQTVDTTTDVPPVSPPITVSPPPVTMPPPPPPPPPPSGCGLIDANGACVNYADCIPGVNYSFVFTGWTLPALGLATDPNGHTWVRIAGPDPISNIITVGCYNPPPSPPTPCVPSEPGIRSAGVVSAQPNFDGTWTTVPALPGRVVHCEPQPGPLPWLCSYESPGVVCPPSSPPASPPPPAACPPTLPPGCPQLPPIVIQVPPCPTLPPTSPLPSSPPLPPSPPTTPPPPPGTDGGDWGDGEPIPEESQYLFDWRDEYACDRVDAFVTKRPDEPPSPDDEPVDQTWFGEMVTWLTEQLKGVADDASVTLVANASGVAVSNALTALYAAGGQLLNTFFSNLPITGGPQTDALIKLAGSLSLGGWAERLTGAPINYLNTDTEYALRYLSPQYIPEQGELDAMYSRSVINRNTYICLTRAHGNLESWRLDSMQYKFARPSVQDIASLVRRGQITESDWRDRMKLHGFADDEDARLSLLASYGVLDPRTVIEAWRRDFIDADTRGKWLVAAGLADTEMSNALQHTMEVIPPYTDIIRMMVHDVEDDQVVLDYQLDTSFEDKYKGLLETWARQQGIPREAALYLWRSHWTYPSNTATYVMLHRLRRERPERLAWERENPQIPGESDYAYFQRGPRVVTREIAARLLSINDLAPTWVQPLLDISYNPITRTDAIRAYEIGAFDEDQLYNAFRDNGYNDTDAILLVRFEVEQKSRRVANATGVLTIRKVVKYYKGGALGRQDAERLLVPLMTNPTDRTTILDRADAELEAERREARIKRLKRQYMVGAIDDVVLIAELESIGATSYTAGQLAARWVEERAGRLKEPTVRMLCGWYNHGFITLEDYRERLLRLGYDADDVSRIAGVCDTDLRVKQAEKAAKQLDAAQKKIDKLLRDNYDIFTATDKQLASNETQLTDKLAKVRAEQIRRQRGGAPGTVNVSPPPPPPPPPKP